MPYSTQAQRPSFEAKMNVFKIKIMERGVPSSSGGIGRPDTDVATLPTVMIRPVRARSMGATRSLKQK
jgi:hypothetical protein